MAGDSQPAVMYTPTKSNMFLELVVREWRGSERGVLISQWLRLVERLPGHQCQLPVLVSISHCESWVTVDHPHFSSSLTGFPERHSVHKWNLNCLKSLGTESIACTLDSFSPLFATFRCLCWLRGKLSTNFCMRFLICNKTSEN